MKRLIALVTIGLTTAFWMVTVAGPAHAKVPGSNGQIVFAHNHPGLPDSVVTTVNPDGHHAVQLHLGEEARWSPDGTELAFTSCLDPPVCDTAAVIWNVDTG